MLDPNIDWAMVRSTLRGRFPVAVIDRVFTAEALRQVRKTLAASPEWHVPDWGRDAWDLANGFQRLVDPQIVGAADLCVETARRADMGAVRLTSCFAIRCNGNAGLLPHADAADIVLNVWLTPDRFNCVPGSGGMTFWNRPVPEGVPKESFTNAAWVRRYLALSGPASRLQIPYRENRAVLFDGRMIHQSQPISFTSERSEEFRLNLTFAMDYLHDRDDLTEASL